jgi:transcriptional regulator with XRE-family HTH domain
MTEEPTTKASKSPKLGPTGEAVRSNVRRVRDAQGVSAAELSKRVGNLGRPIPLVGIQRIESGERRPDTDDLVVLAAALGVSPATLLMPAGHRPDDPVHITGEETAVPAAQVWAWLSGADALNTPAVLKIIGPQLRYGHFGQLAWPEWVREEAKERALDEINDIVRRANSGDNQ